RTTREDEEMRRLMLVEGGGGGGGGECVRMLSADSSRPEDHTARPPCVPSALFANISAIKHWTDSYSDLTTFLANAPVVSRLVLRATRICTVLARSFLRPFALASEISDWTRQSSVVTRQSLAGNCCNRYTVSRSRDYIPEGYWFSGVVTFVKSSQTPCSERKLERLSSACRSITKEHSRPIPDGIHCGYASPAFSDTEKAISYCEEKLLEVVLELVNPRGANARDRHGTREVTLDPAKATAVGFDQRPIKR
ncbi:hypothetical protein ALC62_04606, partial [Cyphomyrmex costatus]